MATLTYYTFSKRKKSTATPTGGTQIDVKLKSGTSLISPTFLLNISGRPTFNYVSFEGRYYFVNDVTSVGNDLWEIACTEDYLASWKSDIGGTTALIMYATGGSDDIIDTRIGVSADIQMASAEATLVGMTIDQLTFGSILLSCTGIGSFGVYLLQNNADLSHLIEALSSFWNVSSVEDALKQFWYGGSASECLKNCIAIPLSNMYSDYSANFGPQEQLTLGDYPCTNGGNPIFVHKVNNPIIARQTTVQIPWIYNDWRRHSPYSDVSLYLPFIGVVTLNADELVEYTSLDITYSLNVTSGDLSVEVDGDSPIKVLYTGSVNISMTLPFGSAAISGQKIAAGAGTGIAGIAASAITAASGGSLAVAGAALFGGVGAATAQLIGAYGGETGGGGGLTGGASQGLFKNIKCVVTSKTLTDSQANLNPLMGKPVLAKHTIGTYAGFVQTDGCQVAGNMLDVERENINSLCDGGIYYE